MNSVLAELVLEGASGRLAAVGLGDLALYNLGVHLDGPAIESRLREYELKRRQSLQGISLVVGLQEVSTAWAASVERELLKPTIARTESERLVELIHGSDQLLLLMGAAGGGKSAVLHHAFRQLERDALTVLGFRIDRLDPFASTTELGQRIGLSVSPVAALAAVAGDRRSVLIVDQVDAVSLMSGRMPRSFDAVADLVREASAFRNMRVVLSCRKFDAENDYRIRELVSDKSSTRIEVAELTDAQVTEAVQAMGLDAAALNTHQLKLLRIPLHLVLLQSIAGDTDALAFHTTKNLFDAFWRRKLTNSTQRRASIGFGKVIATVAEAISLQQRLSVPATVLDVDDLVVDADVLVSEHVLVRDGQQVAFFHESFFDYAFARGWVARNQPLVEFLTSGEQELFRRAQVRQILNHLRELEPDRFAVEVEQLLLSPGVRYHIKHVVLALLKELPEPTLHEWEMVATVLNAHPTFEEALWQSLRAPGWFKRLDTEGVIEDWLAGTEAEQARALEIMTSTVKQNPDRLAQILRPYIAEPAYPNWLRWVARFTDLGESRPMFDLVLDAVRDGKYGSPSEELWLSAHQLGQQQPAWAVELLAAYLVDRPEAMALGSDGKVAALLDRDHTATELARLGAAGAPQQFCDLLLPYMLRVMATTAYDTSDDHRPVRDRHFSFRYPNTNLRQLGDALLAGAASAIRAVVEQKHSEARPILETLAADPHDAAQWLLYEGLRADGETFAQWAADLLLQGSHRFMSGYSENGVWMARQLIQATSSFMPEEPFQRLENAILALRYPRRSKGWHTFNLISGMDEARLSELGRRRLGELRRVFDADEPAEPQGVTGGFIASPISQGAAEHMNDGQWLSAMAKHNATGRNWGAGGAHELSGVLKEQTKRDPDRFAQLALRITRETNPVYAGAILLGLGEGETLPAPTSVFEAVWHIASLGQSANDRWLAWPLRKYLKEVPLDLVMLIADRAANAGDPANGSLTVRTVRQTGSEPTGGRDLYSSGINSARGSAAEVLGDLIIHDADGSRTAVVLPMLDRLATDPAITVRACVAHLIHACMRHARPQALEAFGHLIEADEILLAAHTVERLVAFLGYEDPALARPVIERMLESPIPEARIVGGRMAALAAMQWGMPDLLEIVLSNADVASRQGAATTCAHGQSHATEPVIAQRALAEFFDDSEGDVRKAAASLADALRGERLQPHRELLTQLMRSTAFTYSLPQLLITLERAPDRVDDLVLECSRRFIDVHGAEAGDIRTAPAGEAQRVGELLVRAYAQVTSRNQRTQVLDLLDELLALGAFGVADLIEASER
ncbi:MULTISPECIES: ATP-binding protein [Streptacidiphilus]|uniref:ATP-binding protein n=1 Tax=Streptacidiphilus cavernicola TaxID=3342716 RepID=A0ABV6ULU4_9ACTN|nr:ATP-binding protein [Streptacidiphilus jeojiense]